MEEKQHLIDMVPKWHVIAKAMKGDWIFDEKFFNENIKYAHHRFRLKDRKTGLSISCSKQHYNSPHTKLTASLYCSTGFQNEIGFSFTKSVSAIVKDLENRLLLPEYMEKHQEGLKNQALEKQLLESLNQRKLAFQKMYFGELKAVNYTNHISHSYCEVVLRDYTNLDNLDVSIGLNRKWNHVNIGINGIDEKTAIEIIALINKRYGNQ